MHIQIFNEMVVTTNTDIYENDPTTAWKHWTSHIAYDVTVTSGSLLPSFLSTRIIQHSSINVNCIAVTHLCKYLNTNGTGVIIVSYRKSESYLNKAVYIIADLLDPTDQQWIKYGTGMTTIQATHKGDESDVLGEIAVTVYISHQNSAIPVGSQYVLSVWMVDAETYDRCINEGGDAARYVWK
jgi:hypothetical protein